MFSGTQDKCAACSKTVYPLVVSVESLCYHKMCFKCSHGGCSLPPSNYAALDGSYNASLISAFLRRKEVTTMSSDQHR
ncbi:hypothetical protein Leryth_009803 [Lithospermum erythrorhizon]|nr:hypothetical protein Leryth_009803 [Lithospermum erythrorhizon]